MSVDIPAVVQDVLDNHHALLRRELPRLSAAFKDADPALAQPWFELSGMLEDHLMKEEQILFPMMLALARDEAPAGCGINGPIMQMQHEHQRIEELDDRIRAAATLAGPEQAALIELLDDLSLHAGKEDDLLFPAALLLTGQPVIPGQRMEAPAQRAEVMEPRPPPRPAPRPAARPAPPPRIGLRARLKAVLFGR